MGLNASKRKVLSFLRGYNDNGFICKMSGLHVERVACVKDLGDYKSHL